MGAAVILLFVGLLGGGHSLRIGDRWPHAEPVTERRAERNSEGPQTWSASSEKRLKTVDDDFDSDSEDVKTWTKLDSGSNTKQSEIDNKKWPGESIWYADDSKIPEPDSVLDWLVDERTESPKKWSETAMDWLSGVDDRKWSQRALDWLKGEDVANKAKSKDGRGRWLWKARRVGSRQRRDSLWTGRERGSSAVRVGQGARGNTTTGRGSGVRLTGSRARSTLPPLPGSMMELPVPTTTEEYEDQSPRELQVGLVVPYKSFGTRDYTKAVTSALSVLTRKLTLFKRHEIKVRYVMKELTPSPMDAERPLDAILYVCSPTARTLELSEIRHRQTLERAALTSRSRRHDNPNPHPHP